MFNLCPGQKLQSKKVLDNEFVINGSLIWGLEQDHYIHWNVSKRKYPKTNLNHNFQNINVTFDQMFIVYYYC